MRITINKQTEPVSIESGDKLVLRLGWDKKSKQRIEIYRDAKDVIDISIFSDDNRLFTIDKEWFYQYSFMDTNEMQNIEVAKDRLLNCNKQGDLL